MTDIYECPSCGDQCSERVDEHRAWLTIRTAFNINNRLALTVEDKVSIFHNADDEATVVVILRAKDDVMEAFWCQAGSDDDVMMFHNIKHPADPQHCIRVRL